MVKKFILITRGESDLVEVNKRETNGIDAMEMLFNSNRKDGKGNNKIKLLKIILSWFNLPNLERLDHFAKTCRPTTTFYFVAAESDQIHNNNEFDDGS